MRHLYERLSLLGSFICVGAFGIGVMVAIIEGGTVGLCFAIALLTGTMAMAFDALARMRAFRLKQSKMEIPKDGSKSAHFTSMPISGHPVSLLQCK